MQLSHRPQVRSVTTVEPLPGAAAVDPEPDPTFEQLYRTHRLPMVRLAVLLVDDLAAAEDVVQDAFAALHPRLDRLRDPAGAVGYLRTSVVNGARSMLRRRRTARAYVPPMLPLAPGADDAVLLADEHREVVAALGRLAPRQREVLVLRYWSELSEAEIADTLGISRGAVKSTASRALDTLESMLSIRDPRTPRKENP